MMAHPLVHCGVHLLVRFVVNLFYAENDSDLVIVFIKNRQNFFFGPHGFNV